MADTDRVTGVSTSQAPPRRCSPRRFAVYVDGSYSQQSRVGSWGVLRVEQPTEGTRRTSGFVKRGQHAQWMELRALIEGLRVVPRGCDATVYSDSKTLVEVASHRLAGDRQEHAEPKLAAAWAQFDLLAGRLHKLSLRWVRGHHDNAGNIEAHRLATQARRVREAQAVQS